jgi:methylated-DNA-[protein]-cysteine S-methyltransferase
MIEGARFSALGCYLLVERSGETITKVYFSEQLATNPSTLAEEIIAYVEGKEPRPDVKLYISGFTEFQRQVFAVVQEIPRGETVTYGEVAALARSPGAARAVGQVMARNPFAILVPCHRVVSSRGIGGFAWGKEIKERLLLLEADRL